MAREQVRRVPVVVRENQLVAEEKRAALPLALDEPTPRDRG